MLLDSFFRSPCDAEAVLFTDRPSSLIDVFRAYQHVAGPVLAVADAVIGSDSPLLTSERQLLGAYVSALNNCRFCHKVNEAAAITSGVDAALLDLLLHDIETAPIEPRMKSLFRYVKKLTLSPSSMTPKDYELVLREGWSKRALFDAVATCSLFSMLVRIVEGMQLRPSDDLAPSIGPMLAQTGYKAFAEQLGVAPPFMPPNDGETYPLHPGMPRCPPDEGLLPGQRVQLVNISKSVHSGRMATVLEYVPHAGNWRVELDNAVVIRVHRSQCRVVHDDEGSLCMKCRRVMESLGDEGYGIPQPSDPVQDDGISTTPSFPSEPSESNPALARRLAVAKSRFVRIQERMAREFNTMATLDEVHLAQDDDGETLYFRIRNKWDKGRKALFAKCYTRQYKEGSRLKVLIIDSSTRRNGDIVDDFE
eukprot:Sspe_Gene.60090::Locus_33066_Transcript_1_1_Confidence_1.000_Length_1632::g.60090::m.60090